MQWNDLTPGEKAHEVLKGLGGALLFLLLFLAVIYGVLALGVLLP